MKYQARLCSFISLTFLAVLVSANMWAQGNFVYTNDDQVLNGRPHTSTALTA